MHSAVGRRRRVFEQPCSELTHIAMDGFAQTISDRSSLPQQGGDGSRSRSIDGSFGKRSVDPQDRDTAAEAVLFSADEHLGIINVVPAICSSEGDEAEQAQDEQGLLWDDDWPQLDSFVDFDADFEIWSGCFDDPWWSWIPLPDSQLADPINLSAAARADGVEIERLPAHPVDDLSFPFSGEMAACSWPELAAVGTSAPSPGKKPRDAPQATPDMILDGMAASPLEMYFRPLAAPRQLPPEPPTSNGGAAAWTAQPSPGEDDDAHAPRNSRLISSQGRNCCPQAVPSRENLRSAPLILEAAPAPTNLLGFQKLQEGLNQLDAGSKTCIRDALYRLANEVEQRHCVPQLEGGSSAANRFRSSVWTEAQASSMDRSVAQLLLHRPPPPPPPPRLRRTAGGCQANHVA